MQVGFLQSTGEIHGIGLVHRLSPAEGSVLLRAKGCWVGDWCGKARRHGTAMDSSEGFYRGTVLHGFAHS